MRLPQICLGFSYNWHVLDIIVRHNRPRKEKNAFRGQIWGRLCIDSFSGSGLFCGEKFLFAPQICGEKCVFAPQNYFGIWKLVLLLSNNRDIIVVFFLSPCSRLSLEKVENSPCLSLEKVYRADSFLFLVSYICLVSLNKNFNNCLTIINKFVFLH